MIDDRVLIGLFGAIFAFFFAFLLSAANRWREQEKSRKETKNLIRLLADEIQRRSEVLNNKFGFFLGKNVDLEISDAVLAINYDSSGTTFDYNAQLDRRNQALGLLGERLPSLGESVALGIARHYWTIYDWIEQHEEAVERNGPASDEATSLRKKVRSDTQSLLQELEKEADKLRPRSFMLWLWLWTVGKS